MLPVSFGPREKVLFGAYHAATPTRSSRVRTVGVVVCPPIGWEQIASQRALRGLAEQLSRLGFPVLRFDYEGTGDSVGDELGAAQVENWRRSIQLAIDELKRLAGVSEVSLVGVHLGASLAYLAAAEGGAEIASLVLWAPFLAGRTYLRQVRAYQLLNHPEGRPATEEGEEAAGFCLTNATVASLNELDLLKAKVPAARSVLVLAKDATSPEQKLVDALARGGIASELKRIEGYFPMMQEPRKSVMPVDVFAAIGAFVSKAHPDWSELPAERVPFAPAVLSVPDASERAFFFGPSERMFGVLTEPLRADGKRRPVLVWLNTASDHRVGPNRLYVTLARQLARHGFTSLRFDPTGVGDGALSDTPEQTHAYSAQRLEDAKQALKWLSAHAGAETFVLIGLCSAAYVAFHIALQDSRVLGEILINPQTFVWREGDTLELTLRRSYGGNRYYQRRIRDLETWKRVLRGDVDVAGIATTVGKRLATRALRPVRRWLPQSVAQLVDVKGAFQQKLQRGVSSLLIFGENDGGLDYIEGEIGTEGRVLKRFGRFQFEIVSGVDHTFSQRWMKEWLSKRIVRQLLDDPRFGGAGRVVTVPADESNAVQGGI